jgi:hypothetical protein
MARPSDEVVLAWRSLRATETSGWSTISIAPAGPCFLSAGRASPGNEEALLFGFSEATIPVGQKLPEGHGFKVERVDLRQDGRTWLALTRKASGGIELFLSMVCDISGALDCNEGADEPGQLRVLLGRVRAWQEFMRKGVQSLTPEAEVGLVGEIVLLRAFVEAGVPAAAAIECWVGPLDGVQDFELGKGAVEVKTTVARAGFPAKIGSLDQLDDAIRRPLFVAGLRLREAETGETLPEFVEGLRAAIEVESEATRLLGERLLAAGYLESHSIGYSRRFVLAETLVLEVTDQFPRLTLGLVPSGIVNAIYEIDLDRVAGDNLSPLATLKRLGVL